MNLILFDPGEVDTEGCARLSAADRRAHHLREVLHAQSGQVLRVGVRNGPSGLATVEHAGSDYILRCQLDQPAQPATDILILAIPRPKVLSRCVESAAALGFGKLLLVRSWRTDRSHVEASALRLAELQHHASLGLEQAQRTCMPAIRVFDRFKPFVEDQLESLCGTCLRLVASPSAAVELARQQIMPNQPVALAIGPERGFTEFELAALVARGFAACRAGPHPLRVETALAYLMGHVDALRTMATNG